MKLLTQTIVLFVCVASHIKTAWRIFMRNGWIKTPGFLFLSYADPAGG
ncbi:hypothetical protein [Pedobacter ginsenosidimutans]|nr:hypothetical protein [Pedobacter ginsenosidimutans]